MDKSSVWPQAFWSNLSLYSTLCLILSAANAAFLQMIREHGHFRDVWGDLLEFYIQAAGISLALYMVGSVASVFAGGHILLRLIILNAALVTLIVVGLA